MTAVSLRMIMKHLLATVALLTLSPVSAEINYKEDWDSLAKHTAAPEWLKDAKMGIYFHWGVYSVPAFNSEWYPYHLGNPTKNVYWHHRKTYGDPAEFGYHEFVKSFTGEHFDPEEWAQLFADSGAKFAGPVAEHHDGFSMWDSEITPWNAKDRGPKRDILGELFESLKKRDLKTIATFHHARQLQRYEPIPAPDPKAKKHKNPNRGSSHFVNYIGWPTSSDDPELQLMYGNIPEEKWLEDVWFGKLKEVTDKYQPDIMWFDSWLNYIPENYRKKFCAYYLNEAKKWDKDVVIIRKQNDLPLSFSMNDHEKSREAKAAEHLWMTDDTISFGSWCYTDNLRIKPLHVVLHAAIDTVAKNGVVLLNLSPKADGSIPEDQRKVLKGLGNWLKANGEAIYATRPWITYGEGPTKEPEGGHSSHKQFARLRYTVNDIRYTQSKDGKNIYATILAAVQPNSTLTLEAFTQEKLGKEIDIESITLLANRQSASFKIKPEGLCITTPESVPEGLATSFKITLKN